MVTTVSAFTRALPKVKSAYKDETPEEFCTRRLTEMGSVLPRLADPQWKPTDAEIEFYRANGHLPGGVR